MATAIPTGLDDVSKEAAIEDIEYDLEHPRVFTTPEQIEKARQNAGNTQWGADKVDSLQGLADYMP